MPTMNPLLPDCLRTIAQHLDVAHTSAKADDVPTAIEAIEHAQGMLSAILEHGLQDCAPSSTVADPLCPLPVACYYCGDVQSEGLCVAGWTTASNVMVCDNIECQDKAMRAYGTIDEPPEPVMRRRCGRCGYNRSPGVQLYDGVRCER